MRLQGGLGNQLFQWAYAYSLACDMNKEFYLDVSSYNFDVLREYELMKFPYIHTGVKDISRPEFTQTTEMELVGDNYSYKNRYLFSNTNYVFNGYWQSEKYFKKYRQPILHLLQPTPEKTKELRKKIKEDSVSIHVRRTDYLNLQHVYQIQPAQYFEEALKVVDDYKYIYVFSDDIAWCRNYLKYDNLEYMVGNDNVDDLWMMSMCKHNIIANSSFSWWGAWLNNNLSKTVVAPNKWFNTMANIPEDDIIPEDWIKI